MNDGLPTTLAELLDVHERNTKAGIHTGIPAKVVSYDPATNTIDAEIVVRAAVFDRSGGREYETLPIIPSVPVMWPRAGGFVCRLPIEAGDHVWLAFSEASLAEWRSTGQLSEPTDARRHSIGYPYAIPGAAPDTDPMSTLDAAAVQAGKAIFGEIGGKQIRIGSGGIEFASAGTPPVSPVALAVPTDAALAALAGAVTALTASVAAAISVLGSHTHTVAAFGPTSPPVGTPPSAPPTGPSAPGSTASLLVKSL